MVSRRTAIGSDERSGVLHAANLSRFAAEWIDPDERVRGAVATYWAVSWDLPPGEEISQRIIDFPAVTLSIEAGAVPAPFIVSTVRPGAWNRFIRGRGDVFAIRLRPAGLAVVSDLCAPDLGTETEVTPQLDPRLYNLLREIGSAGTSIERAQRADIVLGALLDERPLTDRHRLANEAMDLLLRAPTSKAGEAVATELNCNVRTIQRVLRECIGLGPTDVARRIRLQEVARRLATDEAAATRIAAELGYVDQAHMIREFKTVTGDTPGQYAKSARS